MIILLVVIGIALGCGLMGAITGIMIDRWIREGEQLEARSKAYESRHAKTQPRTSLVGAPVEIPGKWYAAQPGRNYTEQMVKRMTAAHTVLPEPGKYQPQPARDSGAGTETFTKVDVGATGPIAKLVADNEAWNAQQAVEDEIFRLGLALD